MLSNVLLKSLRDARRSMIWWSLGLVALIGITVLFYPAIQDAPELNEIFDELPEAVMALLGESDLVSPEGYLNSQLFALMLPLLLIFYAVGSGAAAIAGEEERGTLEPLLSHPVGRIKVALQKTVAMTLLIIYLCVVTGAATWGGAVLVEMEIDPANLAAAMVAAAALAFAFGCLALAVGAATGSRSTAIGIGAAVGIGGYLTFSLAPLVKFLDQIRFLSPFNYYDTGTVLREGLRYENPAILLASGVVLLAAGIWVFNRRDLAV